MAIGSPDWTLTDFPRSTAEYSFLLESATGSTETVGRYSFIGASESRHARLGICSSP